MSFYFDQHLDVLQDRGQSKAKITIFFISTKQNTKNKCVNVPFKDADTTPKAHAIKAPDKETTKALAGKFQRILIQFPSHQNS